LSKPLVALLAALAALALIVAGCGGGSDSTGSTEGGGSGSLTKAELIKQGDAICEKGEEELEEEANEFAKENGIDTNKPTEAQQEEVIEQVVAPALGKQAEELRALGTPSGEEAAVEEIFDSLEKGTEELEEDPGQLLKGKNPVEKASQLAKKYGFKECGNE
jgi:hypothetical protein